MIIVEAIKEALELIKREKILFAISFVFSSAYVFLIKMFDFSSLGWLYNILFILYLGTSEIVLVDVVKSLLLNGEISLSNIGKSLKENTFRAFVFLVFYLFSFSISLIILSFLGMIFLGQSIESWGISIAVMFALDLVFAYLLPYYFSVRFSVLYDIKIWKAISKTIKLYWRRLFDVFFFSFLIGLLHLLMLGCVFLISQFFSNDIPKPNGLFEIITFIAVQLNTPLGTLFSVLTTSVSTVWISSSITIYFRKLEELGEFDG